MIPMRSAERAQDASSLRIGFLQGHVTPALRRPLSSSESVSLAMALSAPAQLRPLGESP